MEYNELFLGFSEKQVARQIVKYSTYLYRKGDFLTNHAPYSSFSPDLPHKSLATSQVLSLKHVVGEGKSYL